MPWPTPWREIFGREAPLLIEIGFGGGQFLAELGRARPECNVLGIEISAPSIRRGEQKIKTAGLDNTVAVQGNAQVVLQGLCVPQSIAEIYINFPDPWPKSGHNHRRLINDQFLQLSATRMVPGGLLEIATDHAAYAEAITECIERTPYFESRLATTFVHEDNERLRTKYELIAMDEGRACHYYKWRRNDVPAPNLFPVFEEIPMPHVILQTPLSLSEIASAFEPIQASDDGTHLKLMDVFQSPREEKLLFEAYVNEAPLVQRVALTARQSKAGQIVVGLHEIGFPRPTAGIQLAISHLADWMISLHPAAKILKRNLKTVETAGI